MKKFIILAATTSVAALAASNAAFAQREEIRIVGSSTVFPFTSTVIERFAQATDFPAPVIESTGTGGGMQLFCAGVGVENPDFTGASRPMKQSEYDLCQENGVSDITEFNIGFDGIVFANSVDGPDLSVTRAELWQALAAQVPVDGQIVDNPYETWADINSDLPDVEIEVLGPPPTSGTRDAWVELVMEAGCEEFETVTVIEEADEDRFEAICQTMREDGRFIEAGENDNLIVQRLQENTNAFGIFGFSFLEENADVIKGSDIEGVSPGFDAILTGDYPVARRLFVYVKNQHVDVIPGMYEFLEEYTSEGTIGPDGYLVDIGLIPLPDDERAAERDEVLNLEPMDRY
jgi:phosphate transport system substrate-binding protein